MFNSLYSCFLCPPNQLKKFLKLFVQRLFSDISKIPYKLVRGQLGNTDCKQVARPNHGAVHHMRTLSLSMYIHKKIPGE